MSSTPWQVGQLMQPEGATRETLLVPGHSDPADRRADIDGLRAIAVLMVLLYHLEVPGFEGGYIGVDIFFVISGYLITTILLKQQQRSSFSFSGFYLRRAQRLLPALLLTLAGSFGLGMLLFSDRLFIKLVESIQYVILFVGNVYQWQDLGYFHTQAIFEPLHHLWSLGVEEQFYLLWPLAILWLGRFSLRTQLTMLALIAAVTVLLSQLWLQIDPDAAFYLMPFRGTGLVLGTLLAHLHFHRSIPVSSNPHHLYWVAILVLALSTIFHSSHTPYPGLASLPPVAASAMIIHSGWLSGYRSFLCHPVLNQVGLASYPLYLVHWPLIVFYSNWVYRPLSVIETLGLSIVAVLAGLAMYHGVEKRLIYARLSRIRAKQFLLASGSGLILFLCIGLFFQLVKPHNPLVPDHRRQLTLDQHRGFEGVRCEPAPPAESGCHFGASKPGQEDILLVGDSNAQMLGGGLDRFARSRGLKVRALIRRSCPPLPGVMKVSHDRMARDSSACYEHNQQIARHIEKFRPRAVMLAARWPAYVEAPDRYGIYRPVNRYFVNPDEPDYTLQASRDQFTQALPDMVDLIHSVGGKVILVGPLPELGNNPEDCRVVPEFISQPFIDRRCASLNYGKTMGRLSFANEAMGSLESGDVLVLELSDVFCDESSRSCSHLIGPKPLYFDNQHVNSLGSEVILGHFEADLVDFLSLND